MALNSKFMQLYGYDLLLGSIAAFYVFMAPYTKVEESFNVQMQCEGAPSVACLVKFCLIRCPVCINFSLSICPSSKFIALAKIIQPLCSSFGVRLHDPVYTAVLPHSGLTILVDSVLWRKLLWPELEVFWFNSVLNRSSEWGTHSSTGTSHQHFPVPCWQHIHSFCLVFCLTEGSGSMLFLFYHLFCFISKLPHKELRFIISSLPIFNLSAAIAASRIFNNRKKSFWKYLYVAMLGLFLISLGCTVLTFMASYENYPSGHALKALHKMGRSTNNSKEVWVHIDTFSAMNGISRFCENNEPWREHAPIHGYKCLFSTKGFSGARLHVGFPPISLVSGEASTILPDVITPPPHISTTSPPSASWDDLSMVSTSRNLYSFSFSNSFNVFSNSSALESAGARILRNLGKFRLCYATVIWTAVFTVLVWITNTVFGCCNKSHTPVLYFAVYDLRVFRTWQDNQEMNSVVSCACFLVSCVCDYSP
ncbi:UNVERIFIED_CONTAM: Dol-P-Man:Man(7)GlcNAc(2)-PP-Dol alpha-1,6-mannosyltransferase [Sesamum calycinum]|uniref:Mannosyltransferase n=1 Tax=Sesamum calycinum TaxID=2727403 RepID=A0AAW2T0G4_9LAMI